MSDVLTLHGPIVKQQPERSHWTWEKGPRLVTIVSKDSFESSEVGVFALCYPVCRNRKKGRGTDTYELAHFYGRHGQCVLSILEMTLRYQDKLVGIVMEFSDALFAPQRHSRLGIWLQLCFSSESALPKFLTCEKLIDCPKAILYIQPVHCTGSDAWQNGNSAQLQKELWNVKYRVKCQVFPLVVDRYFFARVMRRLIFRCTSAAATSQQAIQQEQLTASLSSFSKL